MKAKDISTYQRAIGAAIREFRLKRNFSQETLAERAELHRNFTGLVERGGQNPSVESLLRVCGALEITLRELIERAEELRVKS